MAEKGNPSSYTGRLKEEKKKNERRINDLEEEVRKLQEKLKDHEENCQPKIKKLEEEIERLKKENNSLQEKIRKLETDIGDLKESNTFLDDEMKSIKLTNGDLKKELEKLKKFELSEDELIIRQLCSRVQENLLRFVLQEYFDEIQNKRIKDMGNYIRTQISDKNEKKKAASKWKELKKEIKWDDFLIKQLKPIKDSGNDTAHPFLTEEKIEEAKMNLKEKKKLSKNMVEAVDALKNIWKQSSKLLHGPRTRSAGSRDQSGPKNPPTYASKAAESSFISGIRMSFT